MHGSRPRARPRRHERRQRAAQPQHASSSIASGRHDLRHRDMPDEDRNRLGVVDQQPALLAALDRQRSDCRLGPVTPLRFAGNPVLRRSGVAIDDEQTYLSARRTRAARPARLTLELTPGGRWTLGSSQGSSGPNQFDRRSDAEAHARSQASRTGAELVIKGHGGRIEQRSSGAALYSPPGARSRGPGRRAGEAVGRAGSP